MMHSTPRILFWAVRIGLVLGGFACAGLALLLILQIFPEWHPNAQRYIFQERDGDTFRHQPGFVRPPEGNRELENFIRFADEDGFRQARLTADHYPIIALGDSYTEGGQVPWVDVLAETLDVPIRNLGWRGFGPLQYAEVMRQYGSNNHRWILIGYFEGNDLSNIQSAAEQGVDIARTGAEPDAREPFEIVTNPTGNYLYPLEHQIEDRTFELAYISDYLWWLNGSAETYRNSRNIDLLRDALTTIRDLAGDACVGLVYMPVKGHIYLQYAAADPNRFYVLQNALPLQLGPDDWLTLGDFTPIEFDAWHANADNQRMVVREVTDELGMHFIDLVPTFLAANASDPPLYYVYDSHWSQAGHDLAGATIAEYLRQANNCPLP